MTSRFTARLQHGLASGVLLASSSCGGRSLTAGSLGVAGDDVAPELLTATFVDAGTIELSFSEPLSWRTTPDVASFRLSMAASGSYGGYGEGYGPYGEVTRYAEPYIRGRENCWEYCYYDMCHEYCDFEPVPIRIAAIARVAGAADRLRLQLSPALDPSACIWLQQMTDAGFEGGIFTHYSNNGDQAIEDVAGNQLDAIGERWVLRDDDGYYGGGSSVQGSFPDLDPYIPIPCPF